MLETMPKDLLNPDIIFKLDDLLLVVTAIFVLLGLVLLFTGVKRLFHGRFISASLRGFSGLSSFLAGLLLLSIGANLYSYNRLTYEQPIAELHFQELGKQQYELNIFYPLKKNAENFILNGDEWQIDARIIKWHGWAQLLGLNAQYKLERISGRYTDIEEEQNNHRTVYALSPKDEIDYWKLVYKYKKYVPWIDAYYGSATYLPMSDNARYMVSLTQSGLIARAIDDEKKENVQSW